MGRNRTPFVGETIPFVSPTDPDVQFGVRRLANRDIMSYRDKDSVIRFVNEESETGERFVQEKDYPAGTRRMDVIEMGLATWNILDNQDNPVLPTRDTILEYLDPEELDALYDEIFRVNPLLSTNGRATTKKDSSTSSDHS